jgi:hypothetical protein
MAVPVSAAVLHCSDPCTHPASTTGLLVGDLGTVLAFTRSTQTSRGNVLTHHKTVFLLARTSYWVGGWRQLSLLNPISQPEPRLTHSVALRGLGSNNVQSKLHQSSFEP